MQKKVIDLKLILTDIAKEFWKTFSFKRGTEIGTTSTNLNNVTDIGNYYVTSTNIGNITNSPLSSGGFLLKVINQAVSSARKLQIAIPNHNGSAVTSAQNGFYVRGLGAEGQGWSDWVKYTPEQVRNTTFSITSAGSETIAVDYGLGSDTVAMYLITCCRYTVDTDTNSGVYLVKSYKNGNTVHYNVATIKSASGVTITCNGTDITITTTTTYMSFSVLQIR